MLEVEETGGVGVAEAAHVVTGGSATPAQEPEADPQRRSFVPGDVYRLYAEVYALRLQQ